MLGGINVDATLSSLAQAMKIPVIASGGLASVKPDIKALKCRVEE